MTIEILQPKPFDLVGSTILIAGNAVGFESHLTITVTEGHAEVTGAATAGSTQIRQFQAQIEVPDDTPFQLDRLFVVLSDDSGGNDEVPPPMAMVPVLFGPRILPGYSGYWMHTVAAGETLSAIAHQYYDDHSQHGAIQRANPQMVPDADLIFPGQELRIPRAF